MMFERAIGFTGTSDLSGVDSERHENLVLVFHELKRKGFTVVHHGDCVGADQLCHDSALEVGLKIVIHPPKDPKKRAFCTADADEVREEFGYIARNHHIVNETQVLVAMPKIIGKEELRSGTWATVRYARKVGRLITYV